MNALEWTPPPFPSDVYAPPLDYRDPVIEAYERDVDRTLLRENLKLTVAERFRRFDDFARFAGELAEAGRRHRAKKNDSTAG
jgi:hypothetical protein